jgi:tyrosyl-tRNA synthetase
LDKLPEQPRDRQKLLAREIVKQYHGEKALDEIESGIVPKFSLQEVQFPVKLSYILSASGLCKSNAEARRKIQENGVRLDGDRLTDIDTTFNDKSELVERVLQVGKNKFVRLVD